MSFVTSTLARHLVPPESTLGRICYVFAASFVGIVSCAAIRRQRRMSAARQRIHEMLCAVCGSDARVVITGATNGIGAELARELGKHSSVSLLLGCRDLVRAQRMFGHHKRTKLVHVDMLDTEAVHRFTLESYSFLKAGGTGLRLLVNNAGVMKPPRSPNDKCDPTWQTNFFAPFLITEMFARCRAKAKPAEPLRVVQVSARLEKYSKLDGDMLEAVDFGLSSPNPYADSKCALMVWTSVQSHDYLSESNMFVNATTPGMVDTELGRHSVKRWLWPLTKPLRLLLLQSPAEGALRAFAYGLVPSESLACGKFCDGETVLEDLRSDRTTDMRYHANLATKIRKVANSKMAVQDRIAQM